MRLSSLKYGQYQLKILMMQNIEKIQRCVIEDRPVAGLSKTYQYQHLKIKIVMLNLNFFLLMYFDFRTTIINFL